MDRKAIIRLAAPLLALCFAGAALAEPKDAGDAALALATCMGNAQQQYLIELAQCTPSADSTYLDCKNLAELHYALAKIACSQKPAVVARGDGLKSLPLRPARAQSFGRVGAAILKARGASPSIVSSGGRRR
jgi:hypothetical protein